MVSIIQMKNSGPAWLDNSPNTQAERNQPRLLPLQGPAPACSHPQAQVYQSGHFQMKPLVLATVHGSGNSVRQDEAGIQGRSSKGSWWKGRVTRAWKPAFPRISWRACPSHLLMLKKQGIKSYEFGKRRVNFLPPLEVSWLDGKERQEYGHRGCSALFPPSPKILTHTAHTLKQWGRGGMFAGTLRLWFYTLTSLWMANERALKEKWMGRSEWTVFRAMIQLASVSTHWRK